MGWNNQATEPVQSWSSGPITPDLDVASSQDKLRLIKLACSESLQRLDQSALSHWPLEKPTANLRPILKQMGHCPNPVIAPPHQRGSHYGALRCSSASHKLHRAGVVQRLSIEVLRGCISPIEKRAASVQKKDMLSPMHHR